MSKSIKLTEEQWVAIQEDLIKSHKRSVLIIREKSKTVLGFTVRRDVKYNKDLRGVTEFTLDFFDEKKKTFFMLKYSEILHAR